MGFSHRARSSNDRSVRRWIRRLAEPGAFGLQRLGADRGQEAGEVPALAARAEHEHVSFTFLGYAFRARGAPALTVLAIDDPRFVRVKPQADLVQPRGDLTEHKLGLDPFLAVHDTESRRRGSHPPALAEPGVNLSAHRAPIVQPSGRTPNRQ